MLLSNKVYDILKFSAQVFLPALATFIGTVGVSLGYPETTGIIVTILTALATFVGALVGLSSLEYGENNGKIHK